VNEDGQHGHRDQQRRQREQPAGAQDLQDRRRRGVVAPHGVGGAAVGEDTKRRHPAQDGSELPER
jgi:hypothetical protein